MHFFKRSYEVLSKIYYMQKCLPMNMYFKFSFLYYYTRQCTKRISSWGDRIGCLGLL